MYVSNNIIFQFYVDEEAVKCRLWWQNVQNWYFFCEDGILKKLSVWNYENNGNYKDNFNYSKLGNAGLIRDLPWWCRTANGKLTQLTIDQNADAAY